MAEPQFVRGYTVALGIFAAVFLLSAISTWSMADNPVIDAPARWALVMAARLGLAVAALCALVAVLRARRSEFAWAATVAFNVLLVLYFPFGTAASVYWWFRIRARERAS